MSGQKAGWIEATTCHLFMTWRTDYSIGEKNKIDVLFISLSYGLRTRWRRGFFFLSVHELIADGRRRLARSRLCDFLFSYLKKCLVNYQPEQQAEAWSHIFTFVVVVWAALDQKTTFCLLKVTCKPWNKTINNFCNPRFGYLCLYPSHISTLFTCATFLIQILKTEQFEVQHIRKPSSLRSFD